MDPGWLKGHFASRLTRAPEHQGRITFLYTHDANHGMCDRTDSIV